MGTHKLLLLFLVLLLNFQVNAYFKSCLHLVDKKNKAFTPKKIKKIIFDFDGVFTYVDGESNTYNKLFFNKLISISKDSEELLTISKKEMEKNPFDFTWSIGGRGVAFSNEDLFARTNSLAGYLDQLTKENNTLALKVYEEISKKGYDSFYAIAVESYIAMTKSAGTELIDEESLKILDELIAANKEIVIVSNSSTGKIIKILNERGYSAVDHEANPNALFRVRGGANKFILSKDNEEYIDVNGLKVAVDRPGYKKILEEEKPDVVLGDVFSLDLALPYSLAQTRPDVFGGIHLVLRGREYTPKRLTDFFQADDTNDNVFLYNLKSFKNFQYLFYQ